MKSVRRAAARPLDRIRVLVVDDEPLARSGLRKLVEQDGELEWIGEARGGKSAVEAIRSGRPDVVLLDVQMPDLDGFRVVDAVGVDKMPAIVFVTAHDKYAVRAFKASAVDYLMKPFDDDQFAAAMARAKRAVHRGALEATSERLIELLQGTRQSSDSADVAAGDTLHHAADRFLSRLAVRERERTILIAVEDIDWIEAADYYVKVHGGGKAWLLHATLSSLEARLDPDRFVRLHRSAIVNLSRIREMRPAFRGDYIVVLRDGTQLRLPRRRRRDLEERLRQRF
ncbi:MAG TPA: LytTR family DNA-binding domain-containing protein [Gemmatimonadaceae bacterium]|nr:LytTR family DNA-binding domain-containing protein [Gemmatimonadaceae bacterium]